MTTPIAHIPPTAQDDMPPLEAHQLFAADINAVWASWTGGRLGEEDAMTAIAEHLATLRQTTDGTVG